MCGDAGQTSTFSASLHLDPVPQLCLAQPRFLPRGGDAGGPTPGPPRRHVTPRWTHAYNTHVVWRGIRRCGNKCILPTTVTWGESKRWAAPSGCLLLVCLRLQGAAIRIRIPAAVSTVLQRSPPQDRVTA
ncbi:hypothetical protein E2C01_028810 [Portunus trituberculatus]|uniref:Uncharacterized protein n=1 Tax=Portunus trituberculatus TaxID=210409 RepID=A0A5B7EQ35_PORTR|nr:hypothetical protein [Portunus trituberculatus]